MNTCRTTSFACYAIAAVASLATGFVYLLARQFMPYHAVATGTEWSQIEPGMQVLLLALLKIAGAGFVTVGIAMVLLLRVARLGGERRARWAAAAVGLIFWVPVLVATVLVTVRTPATPPWYGCLAVIVLLAAGLAFSCADRRGVPATMERPERADVTTGSSTDPPLLSIDRLRTELARTWIVVFFGLVFAFSQAAMLAIFHPLGAATVLRLQCLGLAATDYLDVFSQWEDEGVMVYYRVHLLVDGVHWVWYSVFFTAVLAWLFEAAAVPRRYNPVLLLPLASGIADLLENRLQHVFLSSSDFAAITDPLPLLSAMASNVKWLLAITYVLVAAALSVRVLRRRMAGAPSAA